MSDTKFKINDINKYVNIVGFTSRTNARELRKLTKINRANNAKDMSKKIHKRQQYFEHNYEDEEVAQTRSEERTGKAPSGPDVKPIRLYS